MHSAHRGMSAEVAPRRVAKVGPIPRSVFKATDTERSALLEVCVREALSRSLETITAILSGGADPADQAGLIQRVFLVSPMRVEDENDNYRTARFEWRRQASYTFLSPAIASIAMQHWVRDKPRAMYQLQQITSGVAASSTLADQLLRLLVHE